MTLKSFTQLAFTTTLISLASSVYAESQKPPQLAESEEPPQLIDRPFKIETEHETVMAIKPDVGPIEAQNKLLTFDWNNHQSIQPNLQNIAQSEKAIAEINHASSLNTYEQEALGPLLYKLGTYYTHIARKPDMAITKLTSAAPFLKSKEQKAWNDNQLAYAYEQRYSFTHQSADKEKSLFYSNKVISELYPKQKNAIVAFATCMKGLIASDDKNYVEAETHFKNALSMYDSSGTPKDNQYFRIKNRLANSILDQSGRDQEALNMLKQNKKYWGAQGLASQNPYAARNMVSLGFAHLKMGDAKTASQELKGAVAIYKSVYGKNTALLIRPYQLLASSYRKMGSLEQASRYEKKASEIVSA